MSDIFCNASAYRDEAGKVVGVFAAARDVTATRRIVESLRASEAKFRIVSDNTYDWEYWLDPQGRFVYCSPSCERLSGHKAEAFLAEPGLLEGLVFPEDWADYRRHVRTTLESPGAEAGEGSGELQFRIIRSDGTIRWVGHVCRAVFDEEKRFLGVRGSNRDITDRKVAEQEFVRLNAELEDRVAERTADLRGAIEEMEGLSYSVAHDLRAPVQAIHGFATLLAKQYGDLLDERGRHLLGAVEKAARQGELLIDDLLAFHRVGRTALVRVPIDMTALVKEVVSEAIPADGDRPVHVSVEEVPDAKGDPELVRTLLENLLSNAVKFSAKREEPVVEVGCRAGPDGPKYFVRDNGVGFEMKSASRLFGLFDRLHGGDEYPGNGIGLALVKRIVERHGGRVWAEGEVDRGATFWFTLGRAGDGRSRPMPRVRVDV